MSLYRFVRVLPRACCIQREDPYLLLGKLAAVRSELERMSFREGGADATATVPKGPLPGAKDTTGLPGAAEPAVWWDEDKGATWLRERQVSIEAAPPAAAKPAAKPAANKQAFRSLEGSWLPPGYPYTALSPHRGLR